MLTLNKCTVKDSKFHKARDSYETPPLFNIYFILLNILTNHVMIDKAFTLPHQ